MLRAGRIGVLLLVACRPSGSVAPVAAEPATAPVASAPAGAGEAATAPAPVEQPGAAAEPAAAAPSPVPAGNDRPVEDSSGEKVGALDKNVIREVVRRSIGDVRGCYNVGLARLPKLAGRVMIQFTIGKDGVVTEAIVQTSTLPEGAQPVAQCIAAMAKKWRFPAPEGGGKVIVSYPFVLEPDQLSPSSLAAGGQQVGRWFIAAGRPANTLIVEVRDAGSRKAVAGTTVVLTIHATGADEDQRQAVTDANGLAVFERVPEVGSVSAALSGGAHPVSSEALLLSLPRGKAMATVLLQGPG